MVASVVEIAAAGSAVVVTEEAWAAEDIFSDCFCFERGEREAVSTGAVESGAEAAILALTVLVWRELSAVAVAAAL